MTRMIPFKDWPKEQQDAFHEFMRQMKEIAIPEIVKAVQEREQLAEDSRREGRILR